MATQSSGQILSYGSSRLLAATWHSGCSFELRRLLPVAARAVRIASQQTHQTSRSTSGTAPFSRRQLSYSTAHTVPLPVRTPRAPVIVPIRQYSTPATGQTSTSTWTLPPESEVNTRPVLILGAGVLGRRLAVMWASTSRPVLLYDSSPAALRSAVEYISDVLGVLCFNEDTHPGHVATTTYLPAACRAEPGPWLVIEALPEELSLKRKVLSEVEALAPRDCILASNSSSFRTAEMLAAPGGGEGADGVKDGARLLNMHHYIPPRNRMVELMSSGSTAEAVFPFLAAQMESVGLRPLVLPADVQSTGFIFNRIWAAVKRETLAVLAEGVARHPADVDELFRDFFHAEKGPCEKMDEVGLDTVAKVEARYVVERPGIGSEEALEWLAKEYVEKGRLGEKSGDGLYTAEERKEMIAERELDALDPLEESKGA